MAAHEQLLEKARAGGIDVYFIGDSITRRWGATDYPDLLANWRQNFFGWNAGNFGWGADRTQNILWRLEHGELDGVNPKVIVIHAGTNNIGTEPGGAAKVAEITRGLTAIVDICRQKAPRATIILTAIFPRNDNLAVMPEIDQVNANLARLADGGNVRYLNVNDKLADKDGRLFEGMMNERDKLHPTCTAIRCGPTVSNRSSPSCWDRRRRPTTPRRPLATRARDRGSDRSVGDYLFRLDILVAAAARHFDPVQFLFHLMKRVVADLFTGTHGENRLARRLKGSAVHVAVGDASGFAFFRIGIDGSQVRDELLPDRLCDRRSVMLEPRQAGTQGAFTRGGRLPVRPGHRHAGRARASSGPRVSPWSASVPSTTENAVSTIKSRNGNAAGNASAAASETMPRMPDHEMTRPLPTVGRSIGRGG